MTQETIHLIGEVSNKIWNAGTKLTHNDLDEILLSLTNQALAEERKRLVEEIWRSSLGQLMRFYKSNRGSGHTYASVKGIENTPNALLLVGNERQKANTGLPKEKQISLGGREVLLSGRRHAIVVDNYALQIMFYDIISLIQPTNPNI